MTDWRNSELNWRLNAVALFAIAGLLVCAFAADCRFDKIEQRLDVLRAEGQE